MMKHFSFLRFSSLALCMAAYSPNLAAPATFTSRTSLASPFLQPRQAGSIPYPPGFGPSTCQRAPGPDPWSSSKLSTQYTNLTAPVERVLTNFSPSLVTDFVTPATPPAVFNISSGLSPHSNIHTLCVQIASLSFEHAYYSIRTKAVTILPQHVYYYVWAGSSRMKTTFWSRGIDDPVWYQDVLGVSTSGEHEITAAGPARASFDVSFEPVAGGVNGEIALFETIIPAGG